MLPYLPSRLLKASKLLLFLFSVFVFLKIVYYSWPDSAGPRFPPQRIANYTCPSRSYEAYTPFTNFSPNETSLTESRLLLLLESVYSRHGKLITQILNTTKCQYKIETFSKNLPLLTTASKGRYSAVVIENFNKYINLPRWNRQLLDKYSKDYKAPIVSFVPAKALDVYDRLVLRGTDLAMWQNQRAYNLHFSSLSVIPWIARPNVSLPSSFGEGREWNLFEDNPSFESVLVVDDENGQKRAAVVRDLGVEDGVEKVLLGHNLTDWMAALAFVDSIRWATKGRCGLPSMDRYVQIDIDDIFVGSRGTRMIRDDVEALVELQDQLRARISNFSFTLGFSGAYFLHGDDAEDEGDRAIIEAASNFLWFPHMWKHNHPQDHNESFLESTMVLNKQFAQDNGLVVPFPYAISPQHGGVYPVHEALYNAWSKVWQVEVTATEEYPHLRPASDRRGFIHKGIKVLPRQTCGLYTHTQFFHLYPGGLNRLIRLIQGGELFWTILLNPISVFMTHQQNFSHDRLASYTFLNLVSFIECWTRLRLRWNDPISNANRYFSLFPHETTPVWNNPCSDLRHRSLLRPSFNCSSFVLPNVLVVGPQKTGTTALMSFLSLHPNISTSRTLPKSFEEVQFFSGENYEKGVEWYSDVFTPASVIIDKSAGYFDHPEGARRAAALLPSATVVILLHDPAKRAYSWYWHLVLRNETSVRGLSMEEVLEGGTTEAKRIRQRCISGGRYAHHLDRWLDFYPSSQLRLIDASALRDEPAKVMSALVDSFELSPIDFDAAIKFVPKKGFFCKVQSGHPWCLGSSKGRVYPPPSPSLSSRLCSLFRSDNIALNKLLLRRRLPIPSWLPAAITDLVMPKYYCDYCDTFLTHDSPSVRKTHNGGRKHKENVRMYYQKWMEDQAQKLVDATAKAFAAGRGVPRPGMGPPGMMPPGMRPMMPGRGAPFPPFGGPPGMPPMGPPFMMPRPPGMMPGPRPGGPPGMPPMP